MWLLMAQVAVILPHVLRLPLWVILICIGCCAWRVMVYQGRWGYPGRWVRGLFVVAGFIGIGVEYQARVYGLESALALLILAIGFKLLEMRHRRDAFILILLSYFVTVTQLLFAQTILFTLYCLITLLLTTAALIGLNQQRFQLAPARTLRLAVILLAQSLPMMLVLFVMVPRVSPFWSVPIPSQVAKSGVSDQMRPGDVATLSLSPALAFKASFSGPVPGASQLYWRGLVLENYEVRSGPEAAS
jgi:protein-glutamine gamma-glutamyltransferase